MKSLATIALASCLILAGLSLPAAHAQVQELSENRGAAVAWQALLRLRTTATVLHTTAHPDDEDAALLTWLARGQGVRTGLLTLNRGEGGANLIGPELYDALGILRTEEMLAAGRYYGLDAQMFTRVADFGFSKRLDETLEHWGKENTLRDVVRAIRRYRPDIIISRFHGQQRDGHGNHQAAGLLTIEAFKAAADPQIFPEQITEGLPPWQAKKLYLSVRPNESPTLKINVGDYDPLLGRSYREIAMEGYGLHRSQSVGQARAAAGNYFSLLKLEAANTQPGKDEALFSGIATKLSDLARMAPTLKLDAQLTELQNLIEDAVNRFDARQTWLVAGNLVSGAAKLRQVIKQVKGSSLEPRAQDHLLFLLNNKDRELNDAVNKVLGLKMEVLVEPDRPTPQNPFFQPPRQTFAVATPGQQFNVSASVVNRSRMVIVPRAMRLETAKGLASNSVKFEAAPLGYNVRTSGSFTVQVANDVAATRLYWSRADELREHVYRVDRPEYFGLPFMPPAALGVFEYDVDNVRFTLSQPAQTAFVTAPFGEQRRLLTVAPAMNVAITPRVGVVPLGTATTTTVTVNVTSSAKGKAEGKVKLKLPEGWKAKPAEQPFNFAHEGETSNFAFRISIPTIKLNTDYKIQAIAEYAEREYTEGYQVIAHRDLEPRHLYRDAVMELRGVDVKVAPNLTVGYVMGVGDKVPEALEQLGVKVRLLSTQDLATGNLDQLDAVIIGIRASAVRRDLQAYNKRLLAYVERGGNLIWQYQTPEFDEAAYGPYPYKLGRNPEEVSEEDAQVAILDAANPVFNWPNKITETDFNGWVEERGSKWLSQWDARYKPLLETNDRGQAPQRGGMLQAQYGKGTFTYAAYAFYRQLPAGVPGAYRLFANLISLRRRPQ